MDKPMVVQWYGQQSCTNNRACVDNAEWWVVMWSRQRGKHQLILQKRCWSHFLFRTSKAQKWRKHSFGYISFPSKWIGKLKMPSNIFVLDHLTFFLNHLMESQTMSWSCDKSLLTFLDGRSTLIGWKWKREMRKSKSYKFHNLGVKIGAIWV